MRVRDAWDVVMQDARVTNEDVQYAESLTVQEGFVSTFGVEKPVSRLELFVTYWCLIKFTAAAIDSSDVTSSWTEDAASPSFTRAAAASSPALAFLDPMMTW